MTEDEERAAVVREAETWLGTPYHGNADVKGAGVDCAMLPLRVYSNVGLVPFIDPRPYPMQWSLHQRQERYLMKVLEYFREIEVPAQGDFVMFKFGKCWAHGGIVVDWPDLIHANPPGECRFDNVERNYQLKKLVPRFFSAWPRTWFSGSGS